uniref:Peptidase A1 domain-containing protein n=1 Tax=Oryza nivara TaxID=4536 RepID=A0A0E0I7Y2_ORYNI
MALARSRSSGLPLAAAAAACLLTLQLLLLLAPPVSPSPAGRLPVGGLVKGGRALAGKVISKFLKDQARDKLPDLIPKDRRGNGGEGSLKWDDRSATDAGLFVFNLSVGTRLAQTINGVLDISSQLTWTQCAPCTACLPPPAPTFHPDGSPSFARLPCASQICQDVLNGTTCGDVGDATTSDDCLGYEVTFSDGLTNTSGYLATDTFTFGDGETETGTATAVPGMVFGCSVDTYGDFSGSSGVIGLGRGPLSLVSQLGFSRFSYQLGHGDSDGGGTSETTTIRFGDAAKPQMKRPRTTPLLTSSLNTQVYFVNLTGIRVDGNDLTDIPAGTFDLHADGSGGVFLSTTMPVTYLEQAAYDAVKRAIQAKLQLPPVDGSAAVGLDLCYTAESMAGVKAVPKLTLVFDGDDATMDLGRANYFFRDDDTGLECVTMRPSSGGSLLGSLLQAGTNMIYDVNSLQLTFETAAAAAAASRVVSPMMMTKIVAVVVCAALLF